MATVGFWYDVFPQLDRISVFPRAGRISLYRPKIDAMSDKSQIRSAQLKSFQVQLDVASFRGQVFILNGRPVFVRMTVICYDKWGMAYVKVACPSIKRGQVVKN